MRRLRKLVPEAEKELADAQLDAARELANRIRARAPRDPDGSGIYARSIVADRLANRPGERRVGGKIKTTRIGKALSATKDPNATGIFAEFIWRFLEFGTKDRFHKSGKFAGRGPAIPHIFPTYRAYKKTIRRLMAGAVNKAVRRVRNK